LTYLRARDLNPRGTKALDLTGRAPGTTVEMVERNSVASPALRVGPILPPPDNMTIPANLCLFLCHAVDEFSAAADGSLSDHNMSGCKANSKWSAGLPNKRPHLYSETCFEQKRMLLSFMLPEPQTRDIGRYKDQFTAFVEAQQ
jgi:hypothetical protein